MVSVEVPGKKLSTIDRLNVVRFRVMMRENRRSDGGYFPMKRKIRFVATFLVSMIGCTREHPVTAPVVTSPTLSQYIPLKVGNSWTYSGSVSGATGTNETSSTEPLVVSIFQTNTLISGNPNAFVVQTTNEQNLISYLAFSVDARVLWHYLGGDNTFALEVNSILWIPGGVGAATVRPNESRKFHITDRSGTSNSFNLKRQPDPSIARTVMMSEDTVQIEGVSVGQTTFALQRIGGSTSDTMTVLVETSNAARQFSLPSSPWVPIWKLTYSSSEETMFSWDTTYSFRLISDSTLCRDELSGVVTNRYLGQEDISALNSVLPCDKFQMKVIVSEIVTLTDKTQERVLYSGPSTYFTVDMWLAKGVGFVRGNINGDSHVPFITMGGEQDSGGVLRGYYLSPRVRYASFVGASASYQQYFQVDDTPLATDPSNETFLLIDKNF